jgi:HlyD family secretion protein
MWKWIRRVSVLVVILGAAGAAAGWYLRRGDGQAVVFQTAAVTRGDLLVSIAATGTLEPEEIVDVGARISGGIESFGKDASGQAVDYGSIVEANAVIARIDDSLYQADVAEADAQVASAKASVRRAEADLGQLKAKLTQARRDWERAQKLGASEALAQATYDAYESAYEAAKANVAVGEAEILVSQAGLTQAEKSLWRARRNLEYCTITSPIRGKVIDRRVSIGQTVTAGMNTPSLFLIAKDLQRMQVWVSVNEADIMRVYVGQPVTFTVDAIADETFHGEVCLVRPNASMTQNVVTFPVVISTDNSAGRLRPYLTANVRFEVDRSSNVLLVPVAALRWVPKADQVAPEYRQTSSNGEAPANGAAPGNGRAPVNGTMTAASVPAPSSRPAAAKTPACLYVVQGQYVRPVPVWAGLSDGINTEVEGDGLREGMKAVTGVDETGASAAPASSSDATSNPFTPKMPKPPSRPPSGGGGPPPV